VLQIFIDGKRIAAIDREHRRIPFPCEPGSTYQCMLSIMLVRKKSNIYVSSDDLLLFSFSSHCDFLRTVQSRWTILHSYAVTAVFFDGRCEVSHGLKNLEVVEIDGHATHLYYDLFTAFDVVKQLSPESITRIRLVDAMYLFQWSKVISMGIGIDEP
jgi:hypothetical protein